MARARNAAWFFLSMRRLAPVQADRLPQADLRADAVQNERDTRGALDHERTHNDLAAEPGGALRDGVEIIDAHIGRPVRRHAALKMPAAQLINRSDVLT